MLQMRCFGRFHANFALWIFVAMFCSMPGWAQEPQPSEASRQPAGEPVSPANQGKKVTKVWTNEDMGAVRSAPISQVGKTDPPIQSTNVSASSPVKPANAQLIGTYRKQLARLQAQQALTEKQIAELKDFNRGEQGHDTGLQLHKRYNLEPIDEQIRKLEGKRKQISDQIDALYDAARKKGIEAG